MGNKSLKKETNKHNGKDLIEELNKIEYAKTFSFQGIETYAKIYSCYDGDTCNIIIKYNNDFIRIRCRLVGINSAEIKTIDKNEKELGLKAKEYISNLILNKVVYVKFDKNDKWGRPLIEIYLKKEDKDDYKKSVNYKMIQEGHAKEYNGKGKKEF